MADPIQLAEKLLRKAETTLEPLAREMKIMKWPAEFQAILWDAVARRASALAAKADAEHRKAERDQTTRLRLTTIHSEPSRR